MGQRASLPRGEGDSEGGQGRSLWYNARPFVPLCLQNEETNITATINSVRALSHLPVEVILVDGGSTDGTAALARQAGAKVVHSPRGRGKQLNAGWRASTGHWCMFLHADTRLPANGPSLLSQAMTPAPRIKAVHAVATDSDKDDMHEGFNEDTCLGPALSRRGQRLSAADSAAGQQCQKQELEPNQHAPVHPAQPSTLQLPTWASRSMLQQPCSLASGSDATNGQSSHSVIGDVGTMPGILGKHEPRPSTAQENSGSSGNGCEMSSAWASRSSTAPVWGCFRTIDVADLPNSFQRWLLRTGVSLRTSLLHAPYGDQILFMQRICLETVGGFPDWPLLEDVELVKRLKLAYGSPAVLNAAVRTSGRRWHERGFWNTYWLNQRILLGYALGVAPDKLAQWYTSKPPGQAKP